MARSVNLCELKNIYERVVRTREVIMPSKFRLRVDQAEQTRLMVVRQIQNELPTMLRGNNQIPHQS